eukprot:2529839-Prymnesium_polylepis.1
MRPARRGPPPRSLERVRVRARARGGALDRGSGSQRRVRSPENILIGSNLPNEEEHPIFDEASPIFDRIVRTSRSKIGEVD